MYGMGKVRENQSLIHLSKRFWILEGICKSDQSSGGVSKVSPKINLEVIEGFGSSHILEKYEILIF